jgi:hypothetical protein
MKANKTKKKTNETKTTETKIIGIECLTLTPDKIMGMGSVKLTGDWKAVKVSVEYLENALKSLKALSTTKEPRHSVVLVIANNMPLGVGDISEGNNFAGVLIAPRNEG